ncbi:MAG: dihydroorotase family protein [Anaerolineae bacterium]|nr:dihydroorotase family protein [Anaerolineae bacterium]
MIADQAVRAEHYRAWNSPRPIAVHAEEETVDDILALVRAFRRQTHFCHISSRYETERLTAAKEEGLPISIGVTPHHLWLTQADLPRLGGFGRMKPELETAADRDALWRAVQNGVVDVIESDHAPHGIAEKESENPPWGVPGLETTLPLLCQAVREGRLELARMVDLISAAPRRLWGVHTPPETYTLVDLDATYIIERARLRTACGWSPFEGMQVCGAVREVWIRGVQVYDGERVLVGAGFGQNGFAA